jgi:hypothetical protein
VGIKTMIPPHQACRAWQCAAGAVRIEPNWDVIGLRGTGSHDLVVEDVFVPDEWTFVRGAPPHHGPARLSLPFHGAGRWCWRWWGWAWRAPRSV